MTKHFGDRVSDALDAIESQRLTDRQTFEALFGHLNSYPARRGDTHRVTSHKRVGTLSYGGTDVCTFSVLDGTIKVVPTARDIEKFSNIDKALDRMAMLLAKVLKAEDETLAA